MHGPLPSASRGRRVEARSLARLQVRDGLAPGRYCSNHGGGGAVGFPFARSHPTRAGPVSRGAWAEYPCLLLAKADTFCPKVRSRAMLGNQTGVKLRFSNVAGNAPTDCTGKRVNP